MGWRILDLSGLHGELRFSKSKRKLLIVPRETGDLIECSLVDVGIIIVGIGVSINAGVVNHLSDSDVAVLFCDWKGSPVGGLYPWLNAHGRVAARQRAQARLSIPRAKNAWMRLVKSKIRGQAANLDCLGLEGGKRLRELAADVKSGDPCNHEAQAARYYWSRIFGRREFVRVPGMRADPLNSMLDYGYTVLRGHSMRAVLAAGLAPTLGVFHRGRGNSFALADDLIEPFRPAVDLAVARIGDAADMECSDVRARLIKATLQIFPDGGFSIPKTMVDLAQQYGLYVESELRYLPVPAWNATRLGDEGAGSNGAED